MEMGVINMNEDTFFFVNTDTGKARTVPIIEGQTVSDLFDSTMGTKAASNYMIRARQYSGGPMVPVAMDHVIQADQAISFTATKLEGA